MRRVAVACWVALGGCNQLLGLDPVATESDRDGDGIPNADDNCVDLHNLDQSDIDGDGVGDACDLCPELHTLTDHDEDKDGVGDECDSCPGQADPEQADVDGDGVGDVCEFFDEQPLTLPTTLVDFDAFVSLDPSWMMSGVPWSWMMSGVPWQPAGVDAITVTGETTFTDRGLFRPSITLPASFIVEIGIVSTRELVEGDRFGVGVVDAQGNPVKACELRCDPGLGCGISVLPNSGPYAPDAVPYPAGALRRLRLTSVAGDLTCHFLQDGVIEDKSASASLPGHVHPVIYGSTAVEITYFIAWRH
jgi:hypothetical protein